MPPASKEYKKLLYLIQVTNSAFPTGAFNHSYGLETLIDEGYVHNAETLSKICQQWLLNALATSDGAAVGRAYKAALKEDINQIIELDNLIGALKLPREVREASYKMGYAFLNSLIGIFKPGGIVDKYAKAVKQGTCEGHQSIAYGIAGAIFNIPEGETILAFVYSAFNNLVMVASRLIPLGQMESQRIIFKSWHMVIQAVKVAQSRQFDTLCTTTASIDIAGMRHEHLYSRICMS